MVRKCNFACLNKLCLITLSITPVNIPVGKIGEENEYAIYILNQRRIASGNLFSFALQASNIPFLKEFWKGARNPSANSDAIKFLKNMQYLKKKKGL